ncbi:MAG: hypothetical protein ACREKH_05220, partial [Candidatus Rokuibacteriota bacterium]
MTLFASLAGLLYAGSSVGLAILLGSIWSVANLLWLEALGRVLLRGLRGETPGALDLIVVLGGLPFLLVGGWAVLASGLPVGPVTIGFSLLYAVVLLKVLGHLVVQALDVRAGKGRGHIESAGEAMSRPMPTRRTLGVIGWIVFAVLGGGLALLASANPADPGREGDSTATYGEHAAGVQGEAAHGGDEQGAGAHGAAAHGETEHAGPPHLPTLTGILHGLFPGVAPLAFLYAWEDVF